jgi:hypothetical protein
VVIASLSRWDESPFGKGRGNLEVCEIASRP